MPQVSYWYGFAGLFLLILIFVDLGCTILRVEGPGPLTRRLTSLGWHVLMAGRRKGLLSHKALSYASPPMLLSILILWMGLTWAAWSLIFMASESALVESLSLRPAATFDRVQFAGQTLATVGLPEIQARGSFWELMATICGLNGFFILTLSVAYLLPLYEAAVSTRSTALIIAGLGDTPEEILRDKWNEPAFLSCLSEISHRLLKQAVDHRAYPVLHFFHGPEGKASLSLRLSRLDEALTLLECGVREEDRLPRSIFVPWRHAVNEYLSTLSYVVDSQNREAPPARPLEGLASLGLQVVDEPSYRGAVEKLDDHRRGLLSLVESQGWNWDED